MAVDAPTLDAWGPPPWSSARREALARALEAETPRLIVWPEQYAGSDFAAVDPSPPAPAGETPTMGIDPLIGPRLTRTTDPGFPGAQLQALGVPGRGGPLPANYVSSLPTVSAYRVVAGDIPGSTFRDRVVVIGRSDRATATVATPLGPMSPAQVEAHALLGVLDGVTWRTVPVWLGLVALMVWALGLARAVRGRGLAGVLMIAAAACGAAALVDLGLFAGGVARIGVGSAGLVAVAVAVAQLVLPTPATLTALWGRRRLRERADAMLAAASTASGVRRWSDA